MTKDSKQPANKLAMTIAAFCASTVSFAQPRDEAQIEEVFVTAQKRSESAMDVPIALELFGAERLNHQRIFDFSSLGRFSASIDQARGNSTNNPVIAIRGVGSTDPWVNNNPSVSAFRDGVYLPFGAYLSTPLYDLERVEVLKGPQAGLYGRNAIAGAINLVSMSPGEASSSYLDLSAGNYDLVLLTGGVDVVSTETFGLRLAGIVKQGGAFSDRAGTDGTSAGFSRVPGVIPPIASDPGGEHGEAEIWNLRATAVWQPVETVTVNLKVHGGSDTSEIVGSTLRTPSALGLFTPPPGSNEFTEFDNVAGENDADSSGAVLQVDWDLGGFTLTSVTGIEDLERKYFVGDFDPFRLAEPTYDEELESFYQELRLASETDNLYWMVGANYTDDSIDYNRVLSSYDFLLGELVSSYNQEDESWSLFAEGELTMSDSLALSGGLRYTDENKAYNGGSFENDPFGTSRVSLAFPGVADGGIFGRPRYSADDLSGQLRLSWTGMENTLVYASISTGFKSGGFDGSGIVNDAGFIPYDPENLLAYEAGIKTSLLDDKLELTAAVYFYDYQDKQVLAILDLGGGISEAVIQNAAESEVFGVDLDARWRISNSVSFNLSAVFLDSEITDWDSDDQAEADARIGNELPGTPETSITAEIQWQGDIGNLGIDSALWLVHADETFRDVANTPAFESESYTLLNARVSVAYGDSGLSLYAFGTNLTDETYVTSVRDLVGMQGAYWGEPRMYGAGIRWDF